MKIWNIKEIFDNGESVTLVTDSGTTIALPVGEHNITIFDMECPADDYKFVVKVDCYAN